jgi:hypothetical protein
MMVSVEVTLGRVLVGLVSEVVMGRCLSFT